MKKDLPIRKHPRMSHYDYSTAGAYYITICTNNRRCILSHIIGHEFDNAEIAYTPYGEIAEEQLRLLEKRFSNLKVDQYVIMPNHIHAIFLLEKAAENAVCPTVSDMVCAYKSLTTRKCKKIQAIDKVFQTSFYEHIIRGQEDYDEIAEYIINNPKQWELDKLYSKE